MEVKRFQVNPLGVNCYVLHDSATREGAIIDCGCFSESEWQEIMDYIEQEGIILRHALQTHLHFDHIFGLDMLRDRYGLQAQCHPDERDIWEHRSELVRGLCGYPLPMPTCEPAFSLSDGQTIAVGNHTLQIIHTPGHTLGGVCFYCAEAQLLFSGDTLFAGSYGRYDLPGGNYTSLMDSICHRLLALPADTQVFPGHGAATSIGRESQIYI